MAERIDSNAPGSMDRLRVPTVPAGYSAVVVTRNRKVLLVECVEAILAQTVAPNKVYILDQASSDGTELLLQSSGMLRNNRIVYIRSETNQGGAGGFYWGMQRAYGDGAQWIWIMDDDAIPDHDAADFMMRMTCFPDVMAVANQKVSSFRRNDDNHIQTLDYGSNTTPYPRLRFSSFVGLLVSRQAIDLVGLPKKEFFFQGDDREYCSRLVSQGDIAFCEQSVIVHKNARAGIIEKQFMGRMIRLFEPDEFCMTYFSWRNSLWILLHKRPIAIRGVLQFARGLMIEYLKIVLVDKGDVPIRLRVVTRGLFDALISRFDNEWAFEMQRRIVLRRPGQ